MKYNIKNYDSKCDEIFQIESIICLRKNSKKYLYLVLPLRVFSIFLLDLFFIWWPKIEIKMTYDENISPAESTHFYIKTSKLF